MTDRKLISGKAAPLNIANLDTDQIMPKQFLRGIDKKGLDKGLLWDMRFDGEGQVRPEFVLNKPEYADANILITGPNFGCGSSREHAVWGLQQFGIRAVIASGFGEIFYSNAMNNGLVAVMLPQDDVDALLAEMDANGPLPVDIALDRLEVQALGRNMTFQLSERHQNMLLQGLDMVGASLQYEQEIVEFAQRHWARQPWAKDVGRSVSIGLKH
ncbi:MAG: 3-isopropylmalate dehydratase small subunit [Thiolinea sp.]